MTIDMDNDDDLLKPLVDHSHGKWTAIWRDLDEGCAIVVPGDRAVSAFNSATRFAERYRRGWFVRRQRVDDGMKIWFAQGVLMHRRPRILREKISLYNF